MDVMDLITETVDADSWLDNGGDLGTITYVEWTKSLVVTHTPATHEKIARLLEELAPRVRVLSLKVRLVELDAEALADQTEVSEGVTRFTGDPTDLPSVLQAQVTGFDGEPQTITSGRDIPYIAGIMPVVAANAVGYQPVIETLRDGIRLQVTPELSEDATSVRVGLDGSIRRVEEDRRPTTLPTAGTGTGEAPIGLVERPVVVRQEIDARLRIPVNTWVLVGTVGGLRDAEDEQADPLYLLVRVDTDGEASE